MFFLCFLLKELGWSCGSKAHMVRSSFVRAAASNNGLFIFNKAIVLKQSFVNTTPSLGVDHHHLLMALILIRAFLSKLSIKHWQTTLDTFLLISSLSWQNLVFSTNTFLNLLMHDDSGERGKSGNWNGFFEHLLTNASSRLGVFKIRLLSANSTKELRFTDSR